VEDGGSGEGGGWWVERRFCQFAQLDHELYIQHASALQTSGAQLPSKLRLPGSLETEARQRTPALQAYLSRLARDGTLLRSEPLFYFLAAHRAPPRQRLWTQLTTGSVPAAARAD
jgi:hypothetical protein